MTKAIFLSFALTALILLVNPSEALAAGDDHWCIPPTRDDCYLEQFRQKVGDVIDLDKHIKQVIMWTLNGLVYIVSGSDPSGQTASMIENNPLAFVSNTAYQLAFNPPAMDTAGYLSYKLNDNILAPPKVLAASGSDILKGDPPIFYELWKNSRNVSYAFLSLFIVAIGFMVMIRYQTDPRTTVAALDLIPKLVMTLILITFSWVISGLLVDLAVVGVRLTVSIFGDPGYSGMMGALKVFVDVILTHDVGDWYTRTLAPWEVGAAVIQSVISIVVIFPLILALIALIIMLVAFFMIIVELAKRWLMLIVLSIFAPFVFLWGALPGQEDTTTNWFKNMLVNALVFPAVTAVLALAGIFAMSSSAVKTPDIFPVIGTIGIPYISLIMFVSLLFMATKVHAVIEDLLEIKAGGAARAGLQAGKVMGGLPFVGKMFK